MDEVLETLELSVEDYLKTFDPDTVDYEFVKKRTDRLAKVVVRKIKGGDGKLYEDSTFIEKTGVQYTVRAVLD